MRSETNDGVTGAELLCSTFLLYLKLVDFIAFNKSTQLDFADICIGFLLHRPLVFFSMSQIPTPPASRPGSEAPEVKVKPVALEDSVQCLDTLLEKYLYLLDRQQKLHSSLAEQLSSV